MSQPEEEVNLPDSVFDNLSEPLDDDPLSWAVCVTQHKLCLSDDNKVVFCVQDKALWYRVKEHVHGTRIRQLY